MQSVPPSQQRLPRASNDHGYERVDSTQLHSNYREREERDEMYHEEDEGRFDGEVRRCCSPPRSVAIILNKSVIIE
jgi:hypothetical protein